MFNSVSVSIPEPYQQLACSFPSMQRLQERILEIENIVHHEEYTLHPFLPKCCIRFVKKCEAWN